MSQSHLVSVHQLLPVSSCLYVASSQVRTSRAHSLRARLSHSQPLVLVLLLLLFSYPRLILLQRSIHTTSNISAPSCPVSHTYISVSSLNPFPHSPNPPLTAPIPALSPAGRSLSPRRPVPQSRSPVPQTLSPILQSLRLSPSSSSSHRHRAEAAASGEDAAEQAAQQRAGTVAAPARGAH